MDFKMVGTLSMSKNTDKFKSYEDKVYDSGWERKVLKFNVASGDNRHMLTIQGGAFADGHGMVYTFTKNGVDESGNKIKGKSLQVPFNDRLNPKYVEQVADFKTFVVDLERYGRRNKLVALADKINEGTSVTDEELKAVGLTSESEVINALEESKKLRNVFISEFDFVDCVKNVIESGKYNNAKFYIRGNYEFSYNTNTGKIYESLVPNKIYLANPEDEPYAQANIKLLFGKESLDDLSVDEKGKLYINGWTMEYENQLKKNIPVPVTVTVATPGEDSDDKVKKLYAGIKRKFTVNDDTINELGITVDMLNGAQKEEINIDDLSDEIREDIECGLITLDDVRKELGMSYGERIVEKRFNSIARGYMGKGKSETAYSIEDMEIKTENELDEDLFDDDDEI